MRRLRQVLVIAAVTLALDFVLTDTVFFQVLGALSTGEAGVYTTAVPYHHGLTPNYATTRVWGNVTYPWRTDRFGFRTGDCAPAEPRSELKQVFVIGDSFTEGIGSTFEQSFAGLMACAGKARGEQVWNLGVMSYSPAIYFRKIAAAVSKLGVTPSEIVVFLDLSDIDDDANVYRVRPDGEIAGASASERTGPFFETARFLVHHFTTVRLAYDVWLMSSFNYSASLARPRARWAFDPALQEAWGRRGLKLAAANLDRIVALCLGWNCRLTLVVYPWPDNVVARDEDSLQVTYWRDWAAGRNVRFVDGFAPFFREPATDTLRKYFIAGDIHFTTAGHRLLFDTVRQDAAASWR